MKEDLSLTKAKIRQWRFLIIFTLAMSPRSLSASPSVVEVPLNPSGQITRTCQAILGVKDFSEVDDSAIRPEIEQVMNQIRKKIVGQEALIEKIMIAILAGGHVLLEGPPGVAKTRTAATFATATGSKWIKIPFVPDMMPRDITGSVESTGPDGQKVLVGSQLPHHILLIDEINRAPERVQSALLEVMAEKRFTVSGHTIVVPDFFIILATQNPAEERGTFALPKAQLDRFLMKLLVNYPRAEDERILLRMTVGEMSDQFQQREIDQIYDHSVSSPETILAARKLVLGTRVPEEVETYILTIAQASRTPDMYTHKLSQLILGEIGPRGSQSLLLASMARAWLNGHPSVEIADVDAIAPDVLRHRISLTDEAILDRVSVEKVIEDLLLAAKAPRKRR